MAEYRDDNMDTVVVSDMTTLGLRAHLEDILRASASVLVGVTVLASDGLSISDAVADERVARSFVTDTLALSDELGGQFEGAQLVEDRLKVRDAMRTRSAIWLEDAAQVSDELLATTRSPVVDTLVLAETWSDVLSAAGLVTDTLKIRDSVGQRVSSLVEDTLTASDGTVSRLRVTQRLVDTLQASDELGGGVIGAGHLQDSATVSSEVFDRLEALQQIEDFAQIADSLAFESGLGQIWVANTDGTGWPMSRYTISATSLTVINDVLHVLTPEGVFAMDGDSETIEAGMVTGRVDMAQNGPQLGVPVSMYLEYELASDDPLLEVGVTQYQGGSAAESWSYELPAEPGEMLTNGRVKFGKGLRGRHFTFDISITAQRSYLNDIAVLFAPGSRRI